MIMDLSEVILNLKMDSDIMGTRNAMVYLENHREFRSDTRKYSSENYVNCFGSKIFCLPFAAISSFHVGNVPLLQEDQLQVRSDGLKKLASEIENVKYLIWELEFLIRKIPARDTDISIRLIVQHLRYLSENVVPSREEIIIMHNDTPLLALGCMLQSLMLSEFTYVLASNESAVICYLFTELCRKAGLNCVKLVIVDALQAQENECVKFTNIFSSMAPEVFGVVTDKSDVDSALDLFLNSQNHPFPLTRIFVQESIYTEFKNTIAWKCRSQQRDNLTLESNSMGAFRYKAKTIYLDYAGTLQERGDHNDQLIFVEAYRTPNELLTLLNNERKPLCLSLWASGISEANEIALKVNIPVIWINDYYNFDGPDSVSQAIFDKTYQYTAYSYESDYQILSQMQETWAALNFNERYEKVVKAFHSADGRLGNVIKEKEMTYWKLKEFISVQNKTIVLGMRLSVPILGFTWGDECNVRDDKQVWASVAKVLINGSAICYMVPGSEANIVGVFAKLAKCGIPVANLYPNMMEDYAYPHVVYKYFPDSVQAKVIWTSFGTTFAN